MSTILLFKDKEVVEGNFDTVLQVRVFFQTSHIKENALLKNGVNIKNIKMCSKEGAKVTQTQNSSLGKRERGGERGHSNALSFEVKHNHMHDHLGNASCIFIFTNPLY